MLPVGQHAARLLLELEGELLGDTVAIAADPPAAGDRAVLDLHRAAVERRASLLVRAAQLSQEAVDDAHVQGAEDDRLAAAHGGGVEMPHGQDVNHRPLSLPCSRSRIARRMRLAPSLIGSGVSGAWATVSGCDRPQGVTTLDVTADHVKLYKRGLLEAGMASATVARRLSVLRGAYEQLAAKGLVSWEIAQDIAAVKAPGVQKNATPSLTQRQAVALLEAIPTDTLKGMRDLALMSVFFLTGCRVSAVTGAIAPVPRISTKSGPFSPGEWLESLPGSARGYGKRGVFLGEVTEGTEPVTLPERAPRWIMLLASDSSRQRILRPPCCH